MLKVLKGEVSPSGRTVDIYTRDFMVDPVMRNFGNGAQYDNINATDLDDPNLYNNMSATNLMRGNNSAAARTIEYEEGIYLGYKYYETMHAEIANGSVDLTSAAAKDALESADLNGTGASYSAYTDADDWYNRNVVYPFGYGLSYTTFEWSDFSVEMDTDE